MKKDRRSLDIKRGITAEAVFRCLKTLRHLAIGPVIILSTCDLPVALKNSRFSFPLRSAFLYRSPSVAQPQLNGRSRLQLPLFPGPHLSWRGLSRGGEGLSHKPNAPSETVAMPDCRAEPTSAHSLAFYCSVVSSLNHRRARGPARTFYCPWTQK